MKYFLTILLMLVFAFIAVYVSWNEGRNYLAEEIRLSLLNFKGYYYISNPNKEQKYMLYSSFESKEEAENFLNGFKLKKKYFFW